MAASETNDLVVGIDAGGTSVRIAYALASRPDPPIWESVGDADPDGSPAPLLRLREKPEVPRGRVVAVVAGVAKLSRGDVAVRWDAALREAFPEAARRLVPDFTVAFHGAVPGGVGIMALAGTGSVIYGEDASGGAARVGGRGWEFGDEGSGGWITAEAVRRTQRAADGMAVSTALTEHVMSAVGSRDAGEIVEFARHRISAEGRGFLIPLITARAQAGDREAADLFVGAAGWLGSQVRTAVARLDLPQGVPIPIATVGGLWEVGELLQAPFRRVLDRFAAISYPAGLVAVLPNASPLIGALRMAQEMAAAAGSV